jgi:hypothetical protein
MLHYLYLFSLSAHLMFDYVPDSCDFYLLRISSCIDQAIYTLAPSLSIISLSEGISGLLVRFII